MIDESLIAYSRINEPPYDDSDESQIPVWADPDYAWDNREPEAV